MGGDNQKPHQKRKHDGGGRGAGGAHSSNISSIPLLSSSPLLILSLPPSLLPIPAAPKKKYPGGGANSGYNSVIPRGTNSPGFLITLVSGKEFVGAREAANILTEHHERLTAQPKPGPSTDAAAKGT